MADGSEKEDDMKHLQLIVKAELLEYDTEDFPFPTIPNVVFCKSKLILDKDEIEEMLDTIDVVANQLGMGE